MVDVYRELAAKIFDVPFWAVTNEQKELVKRLSYAAMYNQDMGLNYAEVRREARRQEYLARKKAQVERLHLFLDNLWRYLIYLYIAGSCFYTFLRIVSWVLGLFGIS